MIKIPKYNLSSFSFECMGKFLSLLKGDNFRGFLFCFLGHCSHSKFGPTLNAKNLLLEEQILSFKS